MRPLQLPIQIMLQLMIGTITHSLERISPKLGELLPVVGMAASARVLKEMGRSRIWIIGWSAQGLLWWRKNLYNQSSES